MTCIDEHKCVGWTQSLRDIQISQACQFESEWKPINVSPNDFLEQKCYVCQFPLRWRCGDVGGRGGVGEESEEEEKEEKEKKACESEEEKKVEKEKKACALQMVAVRNCDRCPACGNVVCKSCLTKSKSLPDMGLSEHLSICTACYYSNQYQYQGRK